MISCSHLITTRRNSCIALRISLSFNNKTKESKKKSETLNDCYYVINLDLLQMMILFASEAFFDKDLAKKGTFSFVNLHDIEEPELLYQMSQIELKLTLHAIKNANPQKSKMKESN